MFKVKGPPKLFIQETTQILNVNRQNEHGIKCCATADVNEPGFISIDEVDL